MGSTPEINTPSFFTLKILKISHQHFVFQSWCHVSLMQVENKEIHLQTNMCGHSALVMVHDVSLSAKWHFDVCAGTFTARRVTQHGFKLRSGFSEQCHPALRAVR